MNVHALVIHLPRATGRRAQVERLRGELPLPVRVIDAIDGHKLTSEDVRGVVTPGLHRPRYPFTLSHNEVACFLSHRAAWQAIVEEGLDAGLVVEDDAAVASPQFPTVLGAALDGLQADEFVRFPHRERHEPGPVIRRAGETTFAAPRLPALGMVMQLVGREAAGRLLEASRRFDRPVDSYVQMHWLHGARVLSARPIVVREVCEELGGSVIHAPSAGFGHKLVRELGRPLIRLAIHRESLRRAA